MLHSVLLAVLRGAWGAIKRSTTGSTRASPNEYGILALKLGPPTSGHQFFYHPPPIHHTYNTATAVVAVAEIVIFVFLSSNFPFSISSARISHNK